MKKVRQRAKTSRKKKSSLRSSGQKQSKFAKFVSGNPLYRNPFYRSEIAG